LQATSTVVKKQFAISLFESPMRVLEAFDESLF